MANPSLKAAFDAKKFIVAPGIFDMISTRVADGMGFDCLYATGFGTVASHLGVADAGIATYTDMVGRMGRFAQMARTPIIADADTGYGGLLNVRHTVMGYETAGISGIQLEDQEMPKKCGHTPGRSVIPAEDMVLKLKVAVEARRDPNFLIVARTDARTSLGLEEAIRRGRMYGDAGADIVFIESPETEAEMVEIGRSINKPLLANNVEGGRTPILPAARLKEIGYSIAIYPGAGFLAVSAALERVYSHLLKNGDTNGLPAQESYGFGRMCELMGFPEVWEFDKKWARKD
ncbi:isocitrate lyase/PEP mutase family protein [Roseococcus sp. SDR]|uniref:isocitrate lyase/PEP mutase family protein n=1 Tax=Roseococcus sp. SDR TaxID=2835532 RepID=UPI001BCD1BBA|nr:isocitrate lyase/PEP mutase family protein [Roseococcus sp. SDR]MBS7790625.1 isocitrate lyase/PEP mutase family protein [Roseococcus sp. SDR]MBV1845939.1 isocitrate lyase/PEP mutase family protein [Roseococcus sp. SDR]